VFRSQNLAGSPLLNAPKWSGNLTTDYNGTLLGTLDYALSLGTAYTDKYQAHERGDPNAVQKSAWRFNASIRIFPQSEKWELALIGRNLTDKFRATSIQEVSGTGSGTGTAAGTTANLTGYYGEPRSISLQAKVRFN